MVNEIPNYLSQSTCDKLIKLIKKNNTPSAVADGSKASTQNTSRTSSTSVLPMSNEVVMEVNRQIAKTIGVPTSRIEHLQGQLYKENQYFKPHYDWFSGENYNNHCLASGNRTHTLMIYLNEGMEGGETSFPKLNKSFKPKTGTALWWENTINGEVQDDVLHSGEPIIKGKKYILTAWIREKDWNGADDAKLAQEYKAKQTEMKVVKETKTFTTKDDLPKFTKNGYEMFKFDDELYQECVDGLLSIQDKVYEEQYAGKDTIQPGSSSVYPIWEIPGLSAKIHNSLLPLMQEWSGQELIPSYLYGFRDYNKGSSLNLHTDRIATHHISAIVMMNKDLRCGCKHKDYGNDWALEIIGHDGKNVEVFFEPQDMLFYESSKCEHGRPKTFEGSNYINFYVHYTLKDWKYIG